MCRFICERLKYNIAAWIALNTAKFIDLRVGFVFVNIAHELGNVILEGTLHTLFYPDPDQNGRHFLLPRGAFTKA